MRVFARQRGIDETVPIERAAGLPSLTTDATYSEFVKKSENSFTSPDRALSAQLQLGVPIYSGGAVKNAVKAAKTRVEAGQADANDVSLKGLMVFRLPDNDEPTFRCDDLRNRNAAVDNRLEIGANTRLVGGL